MGLKYKRPNELDESYIICYTCHNWREKDSEVYKARSKKRGYMDKCIECDREHSLQRQIKHRLSLRSKIDMLKNAPCSKCGDSHPPYVMDFHHRDGEEKLFAVAEAGSSVKSWTRIQAEILKCDLLCANCHRYKHPR